MYPDRGYFMFDVQWILWSMTDFTKDTEMKLIIVALGLTTILSTDRAKSQDSELIPASAV